MLTAEKEGGQIKAHKYWEGGRHGNLNLNYHSEHRASLEPELIHRHYSKSPKNGNKDREQGMRRATVTANPSALKNIMTPVSASGEQPYVIVRRFTLSRSDKPFERMREITQLQYSNWPDFGAPAHPAHLLGLVEQCDAVVRQSQGNMVNATAGEKERAEQRPILVHCSAGCGRTGTFCTVDSVVDMLKKQRARKEKRDRERNQRAESRGTREPTPMEMDNNSLSPQMTSSRMSIDFTDFGKDQRSPFFANPSSPNSKNGSFSFFSRSPSTPKPNANGDDEWLDREDVDLIEKTVEEFRLQRLSMVQSLRQFVLCYESVLEWWAEQAPKTA